MVILRAQITRQIFSIHAATAVMFTVFRLCWISRLAAPTTDLMSHTRYTAVPTNPNIATSRTTVHTRSPKPGSRSSLGSSQPLISHKYVLYKQLMWWLVIIGYMLQNKSSWSIGTTCSDICVHVLSNVVWQGKPVSSVYVVRKGAREIREIYSNMEGRAITVFVLGKYKGHLFIISKTFNQKVSQCWDKVLGSIAIGPDCPRRAAREEGRSRVGNCNAAWS
jgi:hypothetical protein